MLCDPEVNFLVLLNRKLRAECVAISRASVLFRLIGREVGINAVIVSGQLCSASPGVHGWFDRV